VRSVVEAVVWGLSAVALGGGVAAAVAAAWAGGPEPVALASGVVLLAVLAGTVGGVAVLVGRLVSRVFPAPRLAHEVEGLVPGLGDAVRTAVGLVWFREVNGSHALARAHVRLTVDRLRHPEAHALHRRGIFRRSRWVLVAGVLGVAGFVGAMAWAPHRLERGLTRALTPSPSGPPGRQAALPPLWTDVTMSFTYPAYMGRESRTLEGVSGDISAPKGTEVEIQARADRPVRSARLLFPTSEVPLAVMPPRGLSGRFTVQESGRYRLALVDMDGDEATETGGHALTLEPDAAPSVELIQPAEDRTLTLDETLELSFRAKDDFGLTGVSLVVRNPRRGGDPVRRPLGSLDGTPEQHAGGLSLPLATLDARPGDRLVISVEALDNDTVSGPKTGVSASRTIKVFSASEHHADLLARQEELLQRMVLQLADELETPLGPPGEGRPVAPEQEAERWLAQVKRGQVLADALGALAEELQKDRLAPREVPRALRHMREDLGRAYDEMFGLATTIQGQVKATLKFPEPYAQRSVRLGKSVVEKLQQHVLYLDDLMGRQRLGEAQDIAKEIAASQARLRDLLSQYQKAGDDETRRRLMDEIEALRQRVQELARRIAQLQREIPQEYANTDALESKSLSDPLDQVAKMVAEGDLEGAARELERMAQRTQQLLDQLQRKHEEFGGEEFRELREKLSAFRDDLEEVTRDQQALLNESKARVDKARERARRELGTDPDQAADKLAKEAEEILAQLETFPGQGLSSLESSQLDEAKVDAKDAVRALKARDFEEAQRAVREEVAKLEWMRTTMRSRGEGRHALNPGLGRKSRERLDEVAPRAQRLLDVLNKLMPDPSGKLTPAEEQSVRDAARRQGKLADRMRDLGQAMDGINREMPLFGPKHRDGVEQTRRSMREAQASLGGQDLPGARDRQRDALSKLQELQQSMEGSRQGGGGQRGMPMPFGNPGEDDGPEEGSQRNSKDKVEIPGADAFKVPAQFRQDILDAMKEPAPNRFQGGVRKYYEELVK
jgi:hypothetical protein